MATILVTDFNHLYVFGNEPERKVKEKEKDKEPEKEKENKIENKIVANSKEDENERNKIEDKIVANSKEDENQNTEKEPEKVEPVIIRDEKFELHEDILKELPYFETLLSGRFSSTAKNGEGIVKTEEFDPVLFKVILEYLKDKKIYKLFGLLPKESWIIELLEMFRFLALTPPIETDLEKIKEQLLVSSCSTQNDLVEFGFSLFYARNQINWKTDRKYRNNIFERIMAIFDSDDNEAFQPRAKFHLKMLSMNCVTFAHDQFDQIRKLSVPNQKLKNPDYEAPEFDSDSEYCCTDSDFSDYFDSSDYFDEDFWSWKVGGFFDDDCFVGYDDCFIATIVG